MEERYLDEEALLTPSVPSPKEQLSYPEIIGYDAHHAALVVIINSQTGDVWVNEEREDKPETGKKKGDINVISETAKHGETALQTMSYGIMEEFSGTESIAQASHDLQLAWFDPKFCDYSARTSDKPLSVAVGVFYYDGQDAKIKPDAGEEIATKGWMSVETLLSHPHVRDSASRIVGLMKREGIFQEAEAFHARHESVPFSTVLESSFTLEKGSAVDNYESRLRQLDVTSSGTSTHRRPTLFLK